MGVCAYIHVYLETEEDPDVQDCLDTWLGDRYFYAGSSVAGKLHDAIVDYRVRTRSRGIMDYGLYDGTQLEITREAFENVRMHSNPDVTLFVSDLLSFFPYATKFEYSFHE